MSRRKHNVGPALVILSEKAPSFGSCALPSCPNTFLKGELTTVVREGSNYNRIRGRYCMHVCADTDITSCFERHSEVAH